MLQAIENQLHASRDSQLVKNSEQIISNDAGSTVIGFAVALLGLEHRVVQPNVSSKSETLFLLLATSLVLLDAALAIIRRIIHGVSPLQGDRRHFYDLLLARGWSKRRVALTSWGLTAGLGLLSISESMFRHPILEIALFAAPGALLMAMISLGALRLDNPVPVVAKASKTIKI